MRKISIVMGSVIVMMGVAFTQVPDALHTWNVNVTAYSGQDAHWVSPEPLELTYVRYYSCMDANVKVDTQVFGVWVNIQNQQKKEYGESTGPIPPEGKILFQEHQSVTEQGITAEADLKVSIAADGYFHVDVTHFTASVPLRITISEPSRILATNTVYGDLNHDGVLDTVDMTLYANYFVGNLPQLETTQKISDLNCDAEVSFQDLMQACDFSGGTISSAYINW